MDATSVGVGDGAEKEHPKIIRRIESKSNTIRKLWEDHGPAVVIAETLGAL